MPMKMSRQELYINMFIEWFTFQNNQSTLFTYFTFIWEHPKQDLLLIVLIGLSS